MRGYVPTGPGCHHASGQARRRDGWSRGKRLGGGGDSDLCRLLEAYRGEKKGADDVDEGTTNPTEETQEIGSVMSKFREFSKRGSSARNANRTHLPGGSRSQRWELTKEIEFESVEDYRPMTKIE